MSDYLDQVNPDNILNVIRDMQIKLQQLDQRSVAFNRLDEVTEDMGDIRAGRILALESGSEPTDSEANGSFMSAAGEQFGDLLMKVGVVKNGELQFGFGPDAGVFSAGKGIINSLGILMDGLNFVIRQRAVFEGAERLGRLMMTLPDGEKVPVLALEYSSPAGTELLTNGGAESGDLTGWTASMVTNGVWEVTAEGAYAGGYCFRFRPTAVNCFGKLTSNAITVSELASYLISGRVDKSGSQNTSVTVEWYSSGPSLLRTDTVIPKSDGNAVWGYYEKTLRAPVGAVSAKVIFTSGDDSLVNWAGLFDTFSFSLAGVSTRLWLSNRGAYVGNDAIPVVNNRIPAPQNITMSTANSGTAGVVDSGLHVYAVTYMDSFGETYPFASINLTATGGKQANLSNIPIGPASVTARKIYRTKAGTYSPFYLVGTIGNNTATTFVDNVADANLGAESPAVNTTGSWPTLPRRASWMMNEAAHNLTLLEVPASGQIYGATWQTASPNANNGDSFTFSALLAAGTYTLSVLGNTYTTRGMLDWYLDDTKVVSYQDWYSGAAVYNVTKTATITIPTSGYHVLRGKVNGSTGGGYAISLTKIWLKMAAD